MLVDFEEAMVVTEECQCGLGSNVKVNGGLSIVKTIGMDIHSYLP